MSVIVIGPLRRIPAPTLVASRTYWWFGGCEPGAKLVGWEVIVSFQAGAGRALRGERERRAKSPIGEQEMRGVTLLLDLHGLRPESCDLTLLVPRVFLTHRTPPLAAPCACLSGSLLAAHGGLPGPWKTGVPRRPVAGRWRSTLRQPSPSQAAVAAAGSGRRGRLLRGRHRRPGAGHRPGAPAESRVMMKTSSPLAEASPKKEGFYALCRWRSGRGNRRRPVALAAAGSLASHS